MGTIYPGMGGMFGPVKEKYRIRFKRPFWVIETQPLWAVPEWFPHTDFLSHERAIAKGVELALSGEDVEFPE